MFTKRYTGKTALKLATFHQDSFWITNSGSRFHWGFEISTML